MGCGLDHEHSLSLFRSIEAQNNSLINSITDKKDRLEEFAQANKSLENAIDRSNHIFMISRKMYNEITLIMNQISGYEKNNGGDFATEFMKYEINEITDNNSNINIFDSDNENEIKNKICVLFSWYADIVIENMNFTYQKNDTIDFSIFSEKDIKGEINTDIVLEKINQIDIRYDEDILRTIIPLFSIHSFINQGNEKTCLYSQLEKLNLLRQKVLNIALICVSHFETRIKSSPYNFNKTEPIVLPPYPENDSLKLRVYLLAFDSLNIPKYRYSINGIEYSRNFYDAYIPKNIREVNGFIRVMENGIEKWKPWRYIKN